MRHHEKPLVGSWFQDQEFLSTFEVVASDESDGCVEIQYFAGEYSVAIDIIFHMLGIHPFSFVEIGKSFPSGIIDFISYSSLLDSGRGLKKFHSGGLFSS